MANVPGLAKHWSESLVKHPLQAVIDAYQSGNSFKGGKAAPDKVSKIIGTAGSTAMEALNMALPKEIWNNLEQHASEAMASPMAKRMKLTRRKMA